MTRVYNAEEGKEPGCPCPKVEEKEKGIEGQLETTGHFLEWLA